MNTNAKLVKLPDNFWDDKHFVDFTPVFWRTSDYNSFEEAEAQGATYAGEYCSGYTSWADCCTNIKRVLECFGIDPDDLAVRLVIGDYSQNYSQKREHKLVGDLRLIDCY